MGLIFLSYNNPLKSGSKKTFDWTISAFESMILSVLSERVGSVDSNFHYF
jgi:hypothetical protein